jgi:hypothetical protein
MKRLLCGWCCVSASLLMSRQGHRDCNLQPHHPLAYGDLPPAARHSHYLEAQPSEALSLPSCWHQDDDMRHACYC